MKKFLVLILLFSNFINAQNTKVPSYYKIDSELSDSLHSIVKSLELDKDFDVGEDGIEQISLAVIDLNSKEPKLAGVNYDNFIYPASVYKMYVAAEVLNQISQGKY